MGPDQGKPYVTYEGPTTENGMRHGEGEEEELGMAGMAGATGVVGRKEDSQLPPGSLVWHTSAQSGWSGREEAPGL